MGISYWDRETQNPIIFLTPNKARSITTILVSDLYAREDLFIDGQDSSFLQDNPHDLIGKRWTVRVLKLLGLIAMERYAIDLIYV